MVGLAWGLGSLEAQAAPAGPGVSPLHVLEFATDDADDQAKALTLALRARVRASKDYSLAEGDYALGVFLASLKCGDIPDVGCQGRIADSIKADRYIWGTMRKMPGGQVAVDVHLWQRNIPEVRHQTSYSDNMTVPEEANLQKLADQVLGKLVNFGKIGTVKLSSPQSVEGELFIDGMGNGKFSSGSAELTLPTGEHSFEVRSGGKVVAQATGKVSPTVQLDIELTPVKADQVAVSTESGKWKVPASYAAIGVGGALVLVAGYMTVWGATNGFGDSNVKEFGEKFVNKGDDVCDVARNPNRAITTARYGSANSAQISDVVKVCDRGDTFKSAQYVLYPVGALLAAGGAYLLYSSKDKGEGAPAAAKRRRIELTPLVGQQSGFVDLRFSF